MPMRFESGASVICDRLWRSGQSEAYKWLCNRLDVGNMVNYAYGRCDTCTLDSPSLPATGMELGATTCPCLSTLPHRARRSAEKIVVVNATHYAMIKAVIVLNNHGQPRLTKFYEYFPEDRQQQLIRDVFTIVSKRSDGLCNFVEGGTMFGTGVRVIYRHYATLFFVFCVDEAESELGILDLIQVFVETLDRCFENVCELDLIFYMNKIHYVLDEIVVGGLVLETNMADILAALQEAKRAESQASKPSLVPPSRAFSLSRVYR